MICIEDLKAKDMMQNDQLSKCIGDVSFYEFRRQLEYKCKWYGKDLVIVDQYYPSSQLCSCCGAINSETKDLSVREWNCQECGTHHNRDHNAAKNILLEGTRILNAK